jgi:hypothetical protein
MPAGFCVKWSCTMMRSIALAAFTLLLFSAAHASSPAGLYVLVEEVQVELQGRELQSISIRGVYMNEPSFDDPAPRPSYGPVRGWMKFELPRSQPELARLEWKELTSAQDKVVAFGSAYAPLLNEGAIGRLVNPDLTKVNPMVYPVDHGMYVLRKDSKPDKELRAFRDKNPAAK